MEDIIDKSMQNLSNIEIKEEEEGGNQNLVSPSKKKLCSSDDSKNQEEEPQKIDNILEPSIQNVEVTNRDIGESVLQIPDPSLIAIQDESQITSNKKKAGKKAASTKSQNKKLTNNEGGQTQTGTLGEESRMDEEQEESSEQNTTSDEDYQNPLEKGMVMEEYEDEDEFVGMEEEIPSTNIDQKKTRNNRRGNNKGNNKRGPPKKKILVSEDEEESSNSSSGYAQKQQSGLKKQSVTQTRATSRKRKQANPNNESTISEISQLPQKKRTRRKLNVNDSEFVSSNKEEKQLIKDAIDFVNSKPRRRRFNPNKELSLVNPEFLEKIQKKQKSELTEGSTVQQKQQQSLAQPSLNQNNVLLGQNPQQNNNVQQYIDLNKTRSNDIQFPPMNQQLIQQQLQLQNLAQFQMQAMQQIPFLIQQQQQNQQNGQILPNPILLQNYQNPFLLQAQRNAEFMFNIKKEDGVNALQSNQQLLSLPIQQQQQQPLAMSEVKLPISVVSTINTNSANGSQVNGAKKGRSRRGMPTENQTKGRAPKEDESFNLDDLGKKKKYNTRRKTKKQNYAESPLLDEVERDEQKEVQQPQQVAATGAEVEQSVEVVNTAVQELKKEQREKRQKRNEEKKIGQEIEIQQQEYLNKVDNEKQKEKLNHIMNKYHLNSEQVFNNQTGENNNNAQTNGSKGKDGSKQKTGTVKTININPQKIQTELLNLNDNISVDSEGRSKKINMNYREAYSDDNLNPMEIEQDKNSDEKKNKQQASYKLLNYDQMEEKGTLTNIECSNKHKRQDRNMNGNQQTNMSNINNKDFSSDEQEDEEEVNFREEEIPITGHFKYKDKATGVVSSKILKQNIYLEIQWEKRKNGVTPTTTILNTNEVKEYDKDFLIEFYESKILKTNEQKIKKQSNGVLTNGSSKSALIQQLRQDVHRNQMQVTLQQRDKYFKDIESQDVNNEALNALNNQTILRSNLGKKLSSELNNNNQRKIDIDKSDDEMSDSEGGQTKKNKVYSVDTPSKKSSQDIYTEEDPYRKFIEESGLLSEQLQKDLQEHFTF